MESSISGGGFEDWLGVLRSAETENVRSLAVDQRNEEASILFFQTQAMTEDNPYNYLND